MGKINVLVNEYLSDKERFADFINGVVFSGEPLVKAKDLTDVDQKIRRISRNNEGGFYE